MKHRLIAFRVRSESGEIKGYELLTPTGWKYQFAGRDDFWYEGTMPVAGHREQAIDVTNDHGDPIYECDIVQDVYPGKSRPKKPRAVLWNAPYTGRRIGFNVLRPLEDHVGVRVVIGDIHNDSRLI